MLLPQVRPSSGQYQQQHVGGVGPDAAYARLEALCSAIKTELQRDLHIHDQAILPSSVNLPQVTAAEYCKVGPPASSHKLLVGGFDMPVLLPCDLPSFMYS